MGIGKVPVTEYVRIGVALRRAKAGELPIEVLSISKLVKSVFHAVVQVKRTISVWGPK